MNESTLNLRKLTNYNDPNEIQDEDDNNKYTKKNDNTLLFSESEAKKFNLSNLTKFYYEIVNRHDPYIRKMFLLLLLIFLFEHLLISQTEIFLIKISISLIFLVPMLIILFENENFFKLFSIFETDTLITVKLLVLLSKSLSYIQILFLALVMNFFSSYVIKKTYIKSDMVGIEIKDRHLRKIRQFSLYFKFLISGYVVNTIALCLFFPQFEFYLLDEVLKLHFVNTKVIYYFLFLYKGNAKLLNNLFTVYRRKLSIPDVNYSSLYFVLLLFIQLPISYLLTGTVKMFPIWILFVLLLKTYLSFIFLFIVFNFLQSLLLNYGSGFVLNMEHSSPSLFLSLLFILLVYKIESEGNWKVYYSVYARIFKIKILFDVGIVVHYVYSLLGSNEQNYIAFFKASCPFIFLMLTLNYCLIYFCLYLKLNIHVERNSIDSWFDNIKEFIRDTTRRNYGKLTPWYEIKIHKKLSFIFNQFAFKLDKMNKKAMKQIQTFILMIITLLIMIIINNSLVFNLVYLLITQVLHGTYMKYSFLQVIQWFKILYKVVTGKQTERVDTTEKNKKILKTKLKLLYFYAYPYAVVVWKLLISKVIVLLYELFYIKLSQSIFGQAEPLGNIVYHFLLSQNSSFGFLDILNFLIMIVPNTVLIVYIHINDESPGILLQNFCVTNLFGFFFTGNVDLMVIGLLNILNFINLFAADEDTYFQYSLWFDFFGIIPANARD